MFLNVKCEKLKSGKKINLRILAQSNDTNLEK